MILKILDFIRAKNLTCHQIDRFSLDSIHFEPYQDEGEEFSKGIIFESQNKEGRFINIKPIMDVSFFKYFLDGSRYTYKIADMETPNDKYMPIIAAQVATGVCERNNKKLKRYKIMRKNVLMIYHIINKEDYNDIKKNIEKIKLNNTLFVVEKYRYKKNTEIRPENLAIAKIQKIMMGLEIELLTEMVESGLLKPDKMLVIDGSLQFMDKNADERLFTNVIGISKTFNPNLQGLLKNQSQQIATVLTKLKFGQRTPVYKYPLDKNNRVIGAWYIRIREKMKNPLAGIVKVEKIAVGDKEKEKGFESGLINNISQSILLERNVTCHGKDSRWANHIYPIYLTEKMLKESFLSSQFFLNKF